MSCTQRCLYAGEQLCLGIGLKAQDEETVVSGLPSSKRNLFCVIPGWLQLRICQRPETKLVGLVWGPILPQLYIITGN